MASDHDHGAEADREQGLLAVLDADFQAVESGTAIDGRAWLGQYPNLADELARFLEDQERLMRLTEPLRPIDAGPSTDAVLERTMAEIPGGRIGNSPARPECAAPPEDGGADAAPGHQSQDFGDYELIEPIGRSLSGYDRGAW